MYVASIIPVELATSTNMRFLISFLTLFLEAMRPPGAAGLLRRGESKQLQPEVRHHLIPGHRKNLGLAPWRKLGKVLLRL